MDAENGLLFCQRRPRQKRRRLLHRIAAERKVLAAVNEDRVPETFKLAPRIHILGCLLWGVKDSKYGRSYARQGSVKTFGKFFPEFWLASSRLGKEELRTISSRAANPSDRHFGPEVHSPTPAPRRIQIARQKCRRRMARGHPWMKIRG